MSRRGSTERLGDIVSSLMQRRAYARPLALAGLRGAWSRVVGERAAQRTRVAGFRDGVLTVEVESAAERYELESFRSRELLTALQSDPNVPTIRRLVFRVGNVSS
jgi:predicted nucleic acid-binding Zn ribbon protein